MLTLAYLDLSRRDSAFRGSLSAKSVLKLPSHGAGMVLRVVEMHRTELRQALFSFDFATSSALDDLTDYLHSDLSTTKPRANRSNQCTSTMASVPISLPNLLTTFSNGRST